MLSIAFATYLATLGLVGGYILREGASSFTFLYDKWVPFMTASFVMSVAQAAWCYASSFGDNKLLALGGNSGNPIYDVRHGLDLSSLHGTNFLCCSSLSAAS
jgi:delta14-sterol reductase